MPFSTLSGIAAIIKRWGGRIPSREHLSTAGGGARSIVDLHRQGGSFVLFPDQSLVVQVVFLSTFPDEVPKSNGLTIP